MIGLTEALTITLILTGGITFYGGEQFENSNLGCPGYKYERATGPWMAIDIGLMASDEVSCGDWFRVVFSDGTSLLVKALDTGRLSEYTVWDSGLPFVADLPYYLRDGRGTATGRIEKIQVGSQPKYPIPE